MHNHAVSLAAVGVKIRELDLFGPVSKTVQIAQKAVKHTPSDKMDDACISLLAGAHRLVEINLCWLHESSAEKRVG
jgi:hypothetical protein